ncbi:hypothetical protein SLEP1_g37812 [Rubroshorea leprosula]|nr:hypothetical protein SLEP1_g37812 [Rubroshorea leprosula]
MGDLNALLSYADRRGKGPISVSSFSCLEQFMQSCELQEMGKLKWTLENGYQECIQNGWQVHITGSKQYKVMGKLKNCRADLLSWSKKLRGNPQGEIKFLHEQLDFMQNQEPNDANMLHQKMLIQKLNDLWAKEEAYCLSFQFQACHTTADMDIVFSFPPVITSEMNNSLCADITLEEVKAATFQLGAFKAPGLDGFPGVFYQKHWDLVGGDVHKAISRFWATGFLLKEFNKMNIILIPKPFLSQIISPEQSAFVPGKMIQDNLVVAHEAFHGFAHRCYSQDAYMALKLDIHKAYDTADWLFLEPVLRAMGFHDWWVARVMEFV